MDLFLFRFVSGGGLFLISEVPVKVVRGYLSPGGAEPRHGDLPFQDHVEGIQC